MASTWFLVIATLIHIHDGLVPPLNPAGGASKSRRGEVGSNVSPVRVVRLTFTNATSIVGLVGPWVQQQQVGGSVTVTADASTNSVVLQGAERDLDAVETIVEQLDAPAFRGRGTTLPSLLAIALLSASNNRAVALYCHVVEGPSCFMVPMERIDEYQGRYDAVLEGNAHLPSALSGLIIHVMGIKYVEHAPGHGIKLRCERGTKEAVPSCSMVWGNGRNWEPLHTNPGGSHPRMQ